MPDEQGGSQTAGGSSGQAASNVGGNVKQMSIGDLLDLANQQNLDIAPVVELLNGLDISPDVALIDNDDDGDDGDEATEE